MFPGVQCENRKPLPPKTATLIRPSHHASRPLRHAGCVRARHSQQDSWRKSDQDLGDAKHILRINSTQLALHHQKVMLMHAGRPTQSSSGRQGDKGRPRTCITAPKPGRGQPKKDWERQPVHMPQRHFFFSEACELAVSLSAGTRRLCSTQTERRYAYLIIFPYILPVFKIEENTWQSTWSKQALF